MDGFDQGKFDMEKIDLGLNLPGTGFDDGLDAGKVEQFPRQHQQERRRNSMPDRGEFPYSSAAGNGKNSSKLKTFAVILVVLAIIGCLGVMAYTYYTNSKTASMERTEIPLPEQSNPAPVSVAQAVPPFSEEPQAIEQPVAPVMPPQMPVSATTPPDVAAPVAQAMEVQPKMAVPMLSPSPAPVEPDLGNAKMEEDIAALSRRMDRIEASIRKLITTMTSEIEARKAAQGRAALAANIQPRPLPAPVVKQAANQTAPIAAPAPIVQARKPVVSLRAVSGEAAWVMVNGEMRVVTSGSHIPGYGKVTGIAPGRYEVTTESGTISLGE